LVTTGTNIFEQIDFLELGAEIVNLYLCIKWPVPISAAASIKATVSPTELLIWTKEFLMDQIP
jgi:hypothetical protein